MTSLTGLNPHSPNKYVGPNVAINTVVTRNRAPTGADYRMPETGKLYPFDTYWLVGKDPTTGVYGDLWYLSNIVANVANWIKLSSGGSGPLLGFIVPFGSSPVVPNASGLVTYTSTLGTITITGSTNTINFDLSGGTSAIDSVMVDASTPPGTNPVLPTALGLLTITGAQAAAGTTTNVIRTNSLAANTFTIEIQRSQAVASTTIGDNGVCHFNSSHFSVDANGFVSLSGGGGAVDSVQVDAATGPGTNPVLPTSGGLITVTGGQVAAGTTPNVIRTNSLAASTYTIEIQRSQAVASTTIGDNGVCHFDSGVFSVDANGFVSTASGFFTTGTWTPALSFSGGTTGITYAARAGQYTRIGNVVLFSFYILLSNKGSSTGGAQVDGFPFVGGGALPANTSYMNFSAGNLPTESYQTLTQMNFGSGSFLIDYSSGTSPCATTLMNETNFNNNTELLAQGFVFIS